MAGAECGCCAMLTMVGGYVGPALQIWGLIAEPVGQECSSLCCFRSNIQTLRVEAINLDDKTRDLQGRVDEATNNAQLINSQVETWLKNSNDVKSETNIILAEVPNVENGCLKFGNRYSLSKKAKKATIAVKLLLENCNFTEISHRPPPAATTPVESGTTPYEFQSRRKIEEEIVEGLRDENVYKIGICGMGGLGKTTMAQKIMNGALEKELFGEAVMAVVSQPVDKLNIQLQIARKLDLTLEDDDLINRASLLRRRLLMRKKKTLLVLDDVWENLNIGELGIPCEDVCKVLITSRNSGDLRAMNVDKVCELRILDENEAWILFKRTTGTCVDGAILKPIARDVARECKGLPLALVTVGIALKDENGVSIWEDALGQLGRSNPLDIPSIIEKVYKPLKLSYDLLGNPNAKSLFLLCCLFPEDHDVPLEHLAYFAMGLHLFRDIGELKQVRGRTSALVKTLKTRGLLLDGSDEDHVRMHDVVRDVSIYIASEEKRVKCSDCTWISSHLDGGSRLNNVPPLLGSSFPNLELLLMNNQIEKEQEMEMHEGNIIEGMPKLNVLFVEHHSSLKSVPRIISLTSLVLYGCESLESMAAVGQMKSLEILVCHGCHSIKELTEQVRGLKRLRLLKITRCFGFERLAAGVISSLVGLEELKIVEGFNEWKGGEIDIEGNEACLREIESLKKLRCLYIEVPDVALAAQPLSLHSPESLVQFRVQFGNPVHINVDDAFPNRSYDRRMYLDFGDEDGMIKCGNIFLTRTEYLYACGKYYHDFELNLASAQSIRWLTLKGFGNMKNITSAVAAFPLLEYLSLTNLYELEEIWDDDAPIPSNSFINLRHLKLGNLYGLKRMGKCVLSTAKDLFLQLETIEMGVCNTMEHLLVLVPNENEDDITLLFPKLKMIRLYQLPELLSICSGGVESIQFPVLAELTICGCRNLKWLGSRDYDDDHYRDDDVSLHLFCHPKVSFGNLTKLAMGVNWERKDVWCDKVSMGFFTGLVELRITFYYNIKRLFSSSSNIAQNLVNLQKLIIDHCKEIVKVIEDEEVASSSAVTSSSTSPDLFPSLQEIQLWFLPNLESFCERRCAIKLPSLKILDINGCNGMMSFNSAPGFLIITPSLQTVSINGERLEHADDLNAALRQHFESEQKEEEESEQEEEEEDSEEEEEGT